MPNLRAEWLSIRLAQLSLMALLLTLWPISAEVVAPYLISATATTDSTITITWRNNDLGSQNFTVYRGTSATALRAVCNLAGSSRSYSDPGLASSTKYYYAVKAFSAADSSTLSNIDSAITLTAVRILRAPAVNVQWDLSASRITIDVYDSSNCEQGTRVLLSTRTESERVLTDSVPDRPRSQGLQRFVYSGISANAWLYLRAESYADTAVRSSPRVAVYTLDLAKLRTSMPQLYLVKKRSEFPIKLKGWAYRAADSIFLTEREAPTDKYSVINVSNPDAPRFAGYRSLWHPAMAEAGPASYMAMRGKVVQVRSRLPNRPSGLLSHRCPVSEYEGTDSGQIIVNHQVVFDGILIPVWGYEVTDTTVAYLMASLSNSHIVLLNVGSKIGATRSGFIGVGPNDGANEVCFDRENNRAMAGYTFVRVLSAELEAGCGCPPGNPYCIVRAIGFHENDTLSDSWTAGDTVSLAAAYAQPKIRIIGKRVVSGLDPGDFRFGFVDTTKNLAFIVKDTMLVAYDYSDTPVVNIETQPGRNPHLRRPNMLSQMGLDLTSAIKVTMLDLQGRAISTRTYPNGNRIEIARLQRSKSGIAFMMAEQGGTRRLIPVTMLLVGR